MKDLKYNKVNTYLGIGIIGNVVGAKLDISPCYSNLQWDEYDDELFNELVMSNGSAKLFYNWQCIHI